MNSRRSESRAAFLFASPWIVGFLLFLAYPLLASFYFSFTDYSVLRPPMWIGGSNYADLMQDEVFWQSLKNTLIYALGALPLGSIAALGLAMLLNAKVRGQSIFRTLFFIPSLVPMVALAVLWLWMFNGEFGLVNQGLEAFGIPGPNWTNDPMLGKVALILIGVWTSGNAMVIYLAGLQEVPQSLYESADLDGASPWKSFWNVTLPMISPVVLFNVIIGLIGTLNVFAIPYIMFPNGQPARENYYYSMYLFDNAFLYQKMGYASAMGWIMFLITLGLTLFALRMSKRYVHYQGG